MSARPRYRVSRAFQISTGCACTISFLVLPDEGVSSRLRSNHSHHNALSSLCGQATLSLSKNSIAKLKMLSSSRARAHICCCCEYIISLSPTPCQIIYRSLRPPLQREKKVCAAAAAGCQNSSWKQRETCMLSLNEFIALASAKIVLGSSEKRVDDELIARICENNLSLSHPPK